MPGRRRIPVSPWIIGTCVITHSVSIVLDILIISGTVPNSALFGASEFTWSLLACHTLAFFLGMFILTLHLRLHLHVQRMSEYISQRLRQGIHHIAPIPIDPAWDTVPAAAELSICCNELIAKTQKEYLVLSQDVGTLHRLHLFWITHILSHQQHLSLYTGVLAHLPIGIRLMQTPSQILYENEAFHRLKPKNDAAFNALLSVAIRHVSPIPDAIVYHHTHHSIPLRISVIPIQSSGSTTNPTYAILLQEHASLSAVDTSMLIEV